MLLRGEHYYLPRGVSTDGSDGDAKRLDEVLIAGWDGGMRTNCELV